MLSDPDERWIRGISSGDKTLDGAPEGPCRAPQALLELAGSQCPEPPAREVEPPGTILHPMETAPGPPGQPVSQHGDAGRPGPVGDHEAELELGRHAPVNLVQEHKQRGTARSAGPRQPGLKVRKQLESPLPHAGVSLLLD